MSSESATPDVHIWDSDALLAKAKQFASVMQEQQQTEWRFVFWAALTLEILGRAALAKVSPALLADSKSGWENVYYSLGYKPTKSRFSPRSIGMREVLSRLRQISASFTPELEAFCIQLTEHRNETLHTAANPFVGLAESSWQGKFYKSCKVLLGLLEEELASVFGADMAQAAEKQIEAEEDDSAKATNKMINAHRTIWQGMEDGEQAEHSAKAQVWATRQGGHRVDCPACGSRALVAGDPISPAKRELNLDEDVVVERQDHLPSRFECVACRLKLAGFSRLKAAGLGNVYTATNTFDVAEFFAEDVFAGWEPDYNDRD